MKIIFFIAALFLLSFASASLIKIDKPLARNVIHEDLALELEFLGSCKEFYDRVQPSVWVNRHQRCLPIQVNVTNNPDNDDLHTHFFCTNTDRRRSVLHFVEIYDTDETVAERDFVVSLIPSAPFRVLTTKTSVLRRPNCFVTNDYCNGSNAVVNDCRSNEVTYRRRKGDDRKESHHEEIHNNQFHENDFDGHHQDGHNLNPHRRRRGFIVNRDRIYIVANQQVSNDCKTSVSECCPYVTPAIFGGICQYEASTALLEFPREHHDHHDRPEHKPERPSYGKPEEHRPERPSYGRPDDHRDGRPNGRPGQDRDGPHGGPRPGPGGDRDGPHGRPNGRPGDEDDDKRKK
eukprot:TRINITY_DN22_c0_g1_i5.p1 TRINITY_DN22_c0_g1~~TRINITY_DN22_c0_g1_i5.p1  ORF type:complete len:396 (-),score=109.47 TRINITY_DN22_c0_g1_i5:79-1119(-)